MDTCWFCKQELATHTYPVYLNKKVSESDGLGTKNYTTKIIKFQPVTVNIPRCDKCARAHRMVDWISLPVEIILALTAVALVFVYYFLPKNPDTLNFVMNLLTSLLCIGVPTFFIGAAIIRRICEIIILGGKRHKVENVEGHPEVSTLIKDGYKIGKEPV